MSVRILLADDNARFRFQIRELLNAQPDWSVVGEAANGREAVEKAGELQPDVVVIDYGMPELDGLSALPLIRQAAPGAEVVVLTVHDARFTVGRAVEAGARAYVVKSQIIKDLVTAVDAVSKHQSFLSL